MERISSSSGKLLLMGHFNIYIDNQSNLEMKSFLRIINSFGWHQHTQEQTHKNGHVLDLMMSHERDVLILPRRVGMLALDHHVVIAELACSKHYLRPELVQCHKIKEIDPESFMMYLVDWKNLSARLTESVDLYNRVLLQLLNKHEPIKNLLVI